jgi:hypothetical protein
MKLLISRSIEQLYAMMCNDLAAARGGILVEKEIETGLLQKVTTLQ